MWKLLLFDAGAPLFLFPWTVSVLLLENRDVKYMSVVYGLLVGVVIIGRYTGCYYTFEKKGEQGTKMPVARIQCLILLSAFFILSISNRILLVFICYFGIGFASSSLSALIRNHKTYLRKRYRQKWDVMSVKNEILRLNIVSLIVLPLVAGLLFDSNTESLLPALWPCMLVSAYFFALLVKNSLAGSLLTGLARGRVMESVDGSNSENWGSVVSPQVVDVSIDETSVVPSDLYIRAFNGDLAAAKASFITRLKWRKMYNVDNLLETPQQFFDEILENYPHAIHGRSREGCAVVYELIGQGNPKRIIELGMSPDTLVWHFNLRNEYIFRKLSKKASGPLGGVTDVDPTEAVTNLMTVIDVKGVGMSDFTADVLSFMKKSGDTIETYYPPKTVIRLVIVNAPYWFSSVWAMIAKVLPDAIAKKVVFCRSISDLDEFIDPAQRPVLYGGTDPNPLGKSPDHQGFLELAKNWKTVLGDIESGLAVGASETSPAAAPRQMLPGQPAAITAAPGVISPGESPVASPVASESWFSRFGKKKPQKEAYLGKSNSFRFDKTTQSWILDGDDNSNEASASKHAASAAAPNSAARKVNESNDKNRKQTDNTFIPSPDLVRARRDTRTGSLDQLEEHGLILAIQAAHKARTGGQAVDDAALEIEELLSRELSHKKDISSSLEEGTASVVGKIQGLGIYHRKESSNLEDSSEHGSEHEDGSSSKNAGSSSTSASTVMRISGPLFLYVFSAHAVACFCQSCSIWLLPLWVYAPVDHGGLNYSVLDFSMVLSTSGLMLWLIHVYGYERLQLVVSSSPARAIRIGCGSMAFSIFFLPILARATIFSTPSSRNADQTSLLSMFLSAQPSSTPTALLIPSFLVALLIAGSCIMRIATQTILSTSLKNSFAMPDTVITALSGVMDVAGPSIGGVLFSLVYRDTLFRLPLQSFVVYYGVIIVLGVLYSSTLLLNVHFRGDFGIVTERVVDLQDSRRNRCLQCVSSDTYVPVRGREREGTYYILKGYVLALMQAAVNCALDVIAVPHGDLQFLVSPMEAVASHGGHIARNSESMGSYKNI